MTTTTRQANRVALRPFQPADASGVLGLYAKVFGQAAAEAFKARWAWAQESNLAPLETRRWVLAAEGRVVGFVAALPALYLVQGREAIIHTPADFMVDPAFRFHGIKLMQALFKECPNILSFDDIPATVKVTRWLGAEETGKMARYVRVLDARVLKDRPTWHSVPGPLLWIATQGLKAWDGVHAGTGPRPTVQPVEDFDARFQAFFEGKASAASLLPLRDLRFLRWRYGPESPHAGREVAVVPDGAGGLRGYVVFLPSRSRTGLILDLETKDPEDEAAARALLHHAVRRLAASGAWAVKARRLESGEGAPSRILTRAGFRVRGGHHVLARLRDVPCPDPIRWDLQFGDTEASHGER